MQEFALFKNSRDIALKALEEARAKGEIGSSNGASLVLSLADSKAYDLLSKIDEEELATLFGVAKIVLKQGEDQANVKKMEGESCARCRNIKEHLHESEHGLLCSRCLSVMKEGK